MQTATLSPQTCGKRRPRSDWKDLRRHRKSEDARILRGAGILRSQLMKQQEEPRRSQQRSQQQEEPRRSQRQEEPRRSQRPQQRDEEERKSRAVIERETARIREDLYEDLMQLTSSPASSPRPVSPPPRSPLSDDDASFEDLWGSPTRQIQAHQKRVPEALEEEATTATFATRGDASQWADLSTVAFSKAPVPRSLSVDRETQKLAHRETQKLETTAITTNLVESMDYSDDTYDFVEDDYDDDDIDIALAAYKDHGFSQARRSYLPQSLRHAPTPSQQLFTTSSVSLDDHDEKRKGPLTHSSPTRSTRTIDRPPPSLSAEYSRLLRDPAYLHAQKAGFLWQSLVGQQVRFPRHWWNGARSPPLGCSEPDVPWQYMDRIPVFGHKLLKRLVRNRASPGRLLLHIVVQDLMTRKPVQDIAVGCFHASARGIRTSELADPALEDSRDVWIAVRKRSVSVLDPWVPQTPQKTPISGRKVTNTNVRVVFGDQPPVETIFVPENELYERLSAPNWTALDLLEDFVFS
jgi:hypothetical protein